MEQNKTNNVLVAGTIKSIADGGIVVHTTDIYDPAMKMTQSEINTFNDQIAHKYKLEVLSESKYNSIVPMKNVLYFVIEDGEMTDLETRLLDTMLMLSGILNGTTIELTGTINNNTLTLA